jgi:nucleotide-binding universal stress UspA family protein
MRLENAREDKVRRTIKMIFAPTDLSEFSAAGVRYALELGRALGANVTVYHGVGTDELMVHDNLRPMPSFPDTYEGELSRFLADYCADLLPGAAVERKVEIGAADVNIAGEAAKTGADLIVISTHGRTGLSHILMGSVTEKVVRHAPCPVLSIKPDGVGNEERRAATA